jgi:hypothetical protein
MSTLFVSDWILRASNWPPRRPIQVCGLRVKPWLVGLPPAEGWVHALPRSGSVGLARRGQHLFMGGAAGTT